MNNPYALTFLSLQRCKRGKKVPVPFNNIERRRMFNELRPREVVLDNLLPWPHQKKSS